MNNPQYKLLKKICKTEMYDYTGETQEHKDIIHYLAKENFLVYCSVDDDEKKHLCKITQRGKSALYEWKSSKRRWEIPVIISVLAAIGGYRKEIYLITQSIANIWKLLMEH